MSTITATSTTSYTKLRNGTWGIKGHGLKAGSSAVVYKRSGERTTVMVDRIIWTDGNTAIASIKSSRPAATAAPRRTASNWSVRPSTAIVGGFCMSCGNEAWDCDC